MSKTEPHLRGETDSSFICLLAYSSLDNSEHPPGPAYASQGDTKTRWAEPIIDKPLIHLE